MKPEDLDHSFWNERYIHNQMGWDLGGASTPLESFLDSWKNKSSSILIPGAGNAYEAEHAWNTGFEHVTVLDLSEQALKGFHKRVPDFPASHLVLQDFFKHNGKYDLILEQTFFCALHPSLRSAYVKKMAELLPSGGHLAGVLFNVPLNDDRPPFGGNQSEYKTLFENDFDFITWEECHNSISARQGSEWFIHLQRK